jgi:hypothetical protein
MVALNWDEMDQTGQGCPAGQGGPRLYLYVGPEEPQSSVGSLRARPSGVGPRAGAYGGGRRREVHRREVHRREVHRRKFAVRRALAVLVIAGLGALGWSIAERLVASASTGGAGAASCTTLTLACPGAQVYVALPGDTVWSIAVRFAHGGDPRPLVEQLEAEINGGVLQPGQRLAVP